VITGTGTIDLREEKYDLQLTAKSKRPSLLALRGPIVLGGTFKNPDAKPSVAHVATRVGVSAGLGAVAPPLALLPLIDLGGASDVDCRSLIEEARTQTGTTERIPRSKAKSSSPPADSKHPSPSDARQSGAKDAG
jgi:AsmA family protein